MGWVRPKLQKAKASQPGSLLLTNQRINLVLGDFSLVPARLNPSVSLANEAETSPHGPIIYMLNHVLCGVTSPKC
jgi:hypothetical protein